MKNRTKKRSINELRQTKDSFYRPPESHSKKELVKHRFTDSALIDYIAGFLEYTIFNDSYLPASFKDELTEYVKDNPNE